MIKRISLLLGLLLLACASPNKKEQAALWIAKANTAHGTDLLSATSFSFQFREYRYAYSKYNGQKVYSRSRVTEAGILIDSLVNDRDFYRWIGEEKVSLPDSLSQKYKESLNSVLYFVQLPKVLKDPAVVAEYMGKTNIKGEPYIALKVSFQQAGGGVDFQDEYRYWIHEEKQLIDYLAYRFYTNGGGTRFRAVMHRERHTGFVLQDYENYKANEKFPALDDLPRRYEQQALQLVSSIENKDFQFLD